MALGNISKNSSTLSTLSTMDMSKSAAEMMSTRNYAKDLLKARLFLGRYLERRLVPDVGYRDIVLLSAAELELQRDLFDIRKKLLALNHDLWIGITDSDELGYNRSGVCLWTEIDDQPLGPIWFQIKTVTLRDKEIIVKVRCVRHISESYLELEPLLTKGMKSENEECKTDIIPKLDKESVTNFVTMLKSILNVTNIKEFLRFIIAFVIAIFTGGISFIDFLGNFVLGLVREASIFVKNATPMFLGMLDFFSKIVGGFYLLLAMIFKPNTPVDYNKRRIDYYPQHGQNYDHDINSFD